MIPGLPPGLLMSNPTAAGARIPPICMFYVVGRASVSVISWKPRADAMDGGKPCTKVFSRLPLEPMYDPAPQKKRRK